MYGCLVRWLGIEDQLDGVIPVGALGHTVWRG